MIHREGNFFNHRECKSVGVARMVMWAVLGVGIAAAFALAFAILVKVLWNWLMPALFGLPVIGFWQAFGILLLAKILFGGHGHGGHHKDHDTRSAHIHRMFHKDSDAPGGLQREAWVGPSSRDDFNAFWEAEGREAFREFVARQRQQADPADSAKKE